MPWIHMPRLLGRTVVLFEGKFWMLIIVVLTLASTSLMMNKIMIENLTAQWTRAIILLISENLTYPIMYGLPLTKVGFPIGPDSGSY